MEKNGCRRRIIGRSRFPGNRPKMGFFEVAEVFLCDDAMMLFYGNLIM
jgi:hypothetical protein